MIDMAMKLYIDVLLIAVNPNRSKFYMSEH